MQYRNHVRFLIKNYIQIMKNTKNKNKNKGKQLHTMSKSLCKIISCDIGE